MAADITVHASGAETTTTVVETKGNVTLQPREVDTYGASNAVDLADNRALSLLLDVSAGLDNCILEAAVETSADGVSGWREIARFDRVTTGTQQQRLNALCDRYARAAWRIAQLGPTKGTVTFAITARAVGSAT
jgi:hypothetical protein